MEEMGRKEKGLRKDEKEMEETESKRKRWREWGGRRT